MKLLLIASSLALAALNLLQSQTPSSIVGSVPKSNLEVHKSGFVAEAAQIEPEAPKPVKSAPEAPKSDNNEAKLFIYNRESGNRPTARNGAGCLGIGQACPGSKLLAVCPDLADYACQDNFFTQYMLNRYGSWENAKAFHINNNWW